VADKRNKPAPWQWLADRLDKFQQDHLLRQRVARATDSSGSRLRLVQGRKSIVNFGTNDYLGIAHERSLAAEGRPRLLFGSGASPLVSGYSPTHAALERELAAFEHAEATVLLPTGYAANLAVMSTLPEAGDVILSDEFNHASIIDGCRLSRAERFIYPHVDVAAVCSLLKSHRSRFARAFLVTDSVFSMDGDVAPLRELLELCEQYDVLLVTDEAHGTGVLGAHGGGLCDHLELTERVPVRVGTLSKAVGALGGFVAGPQVLIDYLTNCSRPLIYSTALPDGVAQLARESLEIIQQEPLRRERLRSKSKRLTEGLRGLGFNIPAVFPGVPIIPVIVGQSAAALALSQRLFDRGFYVPAIRPPSVPANAARLRISFSAAHDDSEIDALIDAIQQS
jgi:8-amino-7-oxononanoate synthase